MINGKMIGFVTASCMLLIACSATRALAQRGVGDATGMARRAEKPDVVSLSGTIKEVQSGPCKMTTGRATIGTHVLLSDTQQKTLNIHLGPQPAVAHVAEQLKVGETVTVEAFRTEKMSEGHYVATSIKFDEETVELRDENLRPMWAGGRGQRRGRAAMPRSGANARGQGYWGQGYWGQGYRGQGYRGQGYRGRGYGGRGGPGSDVEGPAYGGRGPAGQGRGASRNCPRWGGPPPGRGPGWATPPAGGGRGYGRGRGAGRGPGRGFGPEWGGGGGRGW